MSSVKSLKDLLVTLGEKNITYNLYFRYPDIHVRVVDEIFKDTEAEQRLKKFVRKIADSKFDENCIKEICARAHVELQLETQAETDRRDERSFGASWLRESLINQDFKLSDLVLSQSDHSNAVKVVHFYGFKGGQARSTVLSFLASSWARDGWKVLAVDADMEAPSLHILCGLAPKILELKHTLLGVSFGQTPEPIRVSAEGGRAGFDLVGCFPTQNGDLALESAALALRSSLNPFWTRSLAQRIAEYCTMRNYDLLLIDHRSGLSPSSLPWMEALPGPTIVFARLDGQWRSAEPYLPALFRTDPSQPGILVCFSPIPDPDEYLEDPEREKQAIELIAIMKSAVGKSWAEEEANERLVIWPFDSEVARKSGNQMSNLGRTLRDVVTKIRRLLALDSKKHPTSLIGADNSDFLPLPVFQDALAPNSSYRYIVGRKGTGKTSLYWAMARNTAGSNQPNDHLRGEPLLAEFGFFGQSESSDEQKGLNATDPDLRQLVKSNDPVAFYWCLFASALRISTTAEKALRSNLLEILGRCPRREAARKELDDVLSTTIDAPPRIFLIDGLDRLLAELSAEQREEAVTALLTVLDTIRKDRALSARIDFRLFVRPDLLPTGYRDWEQQTDRQLLRLHWNVLQILHLLLLECHKSTIIRNRFKTLASNLNGLVSQIIGTTLEESQAKELLLAIFPPFVRWNGRDIEIVTFLSTYLLDSVGDRLPGDKATGYPRVAIKFFQNVEKYFETHTDNSPIPAEQVAESYRLAVDEIFKVHIREEALSIFSNTDTTNIFISVMRQHSSPFDPNAVAVDMAKAGSTPSSEERAVQALAQKFKGKLGQFKRLGLFGESETPGPLCWRASPLVQVALNMRSASND